VAYQGERHSTRSLQLLTRVQELEIDYNHNTACNYIRQAALQGAELAVLPE
jgi:predicted amidohydrolase